MAFDRRTMVLPPGTTFEERTIVAAGDFILGNHVECAFGVQTDGRLFGGQGVEIDGNITCTGDLRLDQSSHVEGDVEVEGHVYLGERCFVKGDLRLDGDLDVGDDVKIGGALHAKGWVNKRSPVPLVIYVFIYLLELLRVGQSEEVERILQELEEAEEEDEINVSEIFAFIPDGSKIGLQESLVKGHFEAGDGARILGNLRVNGSVLMGEGVQLYGALRADGGVELGKGCEVQGECSAGGHVIVGEDCQILGDLKARSVEMYPSATVDGRILADEGVKFRSEIADLKEDVAEEKVAEMDSKSADLVDLLG